MSVHEFTIVATGVEPDAEDFEDRFFEAGCDDATISWQKGVIVLGFYREADSLLEAMVSATHDVELAGAVVERFEPDHLVTMSDIAARTKLSRQAISLYANGDRAEGFPHPVARITSESPLWDWVEVAEWMFRHEKVSFDQVIQARLIRQVNHAAEQGEDIEDAATVEAIGA